MRTATRKPKPQRARRIVQPFKVPRMDLYEAMLMELLTDARALPAPTPEFVRFKRDKTGQVNAMLHQWRRIKRVLRLTEEEADAMGEFHFRAGDEAFTWGIEDFLSVTEDAAREAQARLRACPAGDRAGYLKGLSKDELTACLHRAHLAYAEHCQKLRRRGMKVPGFWEI